VRFSALYYTGLRVLGLPTAARELRNAAVVLCYHNVRSDDETPLGEPGLHMAHFRFRD